MKHLNKEIGNFGEKTALEFLKNKNYNILEVNYYTKIGEIDVIAKDLKCNCIVFVEIKSRYNLNFGMPMESINRSKQRKIIKTAQYYILNKHIRNFFFRFDVIEIIFNLQNNIKTINHIENAFLGI